MKTLVPPLSPDVLASPAYAALSMSARRLLVELEAEILQQGMVAAVSRNGTWGWGNSTPPLVKCALSNGVAPVSGTASPLLPEHGPALWQWAIGRVPCRATDQRGRRGPTNKAVVRWIVPLHLGRRGAGRWLSRRLPKPQPSKRMPFRMDL